MKTCSKCKISLDDNEFDFQRAQCRNCRNSQRNLRLQSRNNQVSNDLKEKICHKCNMSKSVDAFHKSKSSPDGLAPKCKSCRSVDTSNTYNNHKEKIKIRCNKYYRDNKEKIYKSRKPYVKNKMNTDPMFRMTRRLRNRLYYALKKKSWKKDTHFSEYIGCSREELLKYIESKFTDNMSWDNIGEWHIDHIIPLSSAQNEDELYKLCHYTNLQPLWAKDNIIKSNKIK